MAGLTYSNLFKVQSSVVAPTALPAWIRNAAGTNQPLPLRTWYKIPNSDIRTQSYPLPLTSLPDFDLTNPFHNLMGFAAKVYTYCGATLRSNGSYLIAGPGGGGGMVSMDNDVATFKLSDDQPSWKTGIVSTTYDWINYQDRLIPNPHPGVSGYPKGTYGTMYYNDGGPVSVQNGYTLQFIDRIDALFAGPGIDFRHTGGGGPNIWSWGASKWRAPGWAPLIPGTSTVFTPGYNSSQCTDQTTGTMYVADNNHLYSWVLSPTGPSTLTLLFTYNGNLFPQYIPQYVPCCFDTTRRRMVFIGNQAPEGPRVASTYMFADLKNLSLGMQSAPISGSARPRLDGARASSSLTYVPPLPGGRGDFYLWYARGMSNLLDARQPNQ